MNTHIIKNLFVLNLKKRHRVQINRINRFENKSDVENATKQQYIILISSQSNYTVSSVYS